MITESQSSAVRHYITLLSLLAAGLAAIVLFSSDKTFQVVLVWVLSFIYVIWGIIHHWIHKDLHPKIILEYLLIAALGALPITAFLLP
jgi:hypothetical protein